MLMLLSFLYCFMRFDWNDAVFLGLLVRLGGYPSLHAFVQQLCGASYRRRRCGVLEKWVPIRLQATLDLSRKQTARIVSSDVIGQDLSTGMLQPSVLASGDAEVAIFGVAEHESRDLDSKRAILRQ